MNIQLPDGSSLTLNEGATAYDLAADIGPGLARATVAASVNGIQVDVSQILSDGDSVTVIKDLKVKGTSSVVKVGTRVKNIRMVEGDHDIDCKVDGIGPMKLKSQFVKKA